MGRLNSHGTTKGSNSRYDEEDKIKSSENENVKYQDEKSLRPRVNKIESRLDKDQKASGNFYYKH